jgi:hypothetical protein
MDPLPRLRSQLTEIAHSAGGMDQRALQLLEPLRRAVPSAATWIAVRDPETGRHTPVAFDREAEPLKRYFSLPEADEELRQFGMNRWRPAIRASDVPVPLPETLAWGDYLLPAGFRNGVAVGLFSADGRHLGFISLLSDDSVSLTPEAVRVLDDVRHLIARSLDRLPSLTTVAELAGDALGAVVLTRSGRCRPLPGMPQHLVLAPSSPVLAEAGELVGAAGSHASFLAPSHGGLLRITVLDCRDEASDHLIALVLARPSGDLAGLDPTDLCLLGGVLEGCSDDEITARWNVPRVVARLEHLAERLAQPSVDALLLHVAREGLHIPSRLWP